MIEIEMKSEQLYFMFLDCTRAREKKKSNAIFGMETEALYLLFAVCCQLIGFSDFLFVFFFGRAIFNVKLMHSQFGSIAEWNE